MRNCTRKASGLHTLSLTGESALPLQTKTAQFQSLHELQHFTWGTYPTQIEHHQTI
jgi:hypothetical protein